MSSLFAIGTLLLVAAVTPGPNNLVVMRTAARSGFAKALPAVTGVVLGGIVLLAVVAAGIGAAFTAWPSLRMLVALGGGLYLVWLGSRLILPRGTGQAEPALPAGVSGLFAFQLLNPKGWIMVLTVVAALPVTGAVDSFLRLAPLFVCIPALCLLLWAGLGHALSRHLTRPPVRLWTDRVLGALLVVSALLLFV
jgi:threonine/homoserine/homoserine lactone efflux protein